MDTPDRLLHLPAMARRLGVPVRWLRGEADAGRLPCVSAGSQRLFDRELVERELLRRAAGEAPDPRPEREEERHAAPPR